MKFLFFSLFCLFIDNLFGQIIIHNDTFLNGNISKISLTNQNYDLLETAWLDNNLITKKIIYQNNSIFKIIEYKYEGQTRVEKISFYKDNKEVRTQINTFFNQQLIKEFEKTIDKENVTFYPFSYKIKEGKLLNTYVKRIDQVDSFLYSSTFYDKNILVPDSEIYFFKSGLVHYQVINKFNEENLPFKRLIYDGKGNLMKYKEIEYSNKLKSKVICFDNLLINDVTDFSKETIEEEIVKETQLSDWYSNYFEILSDKEYKLFIDSNEISHILNSKINLELFNKAKMFIGFQSLLGNLEYIIKFKYNEDNSLKNYEKFGYAEFDDIDSLFISREEEFLVKSIIPNYHITTQFYSFGINDTLIQTKQEIFNYWSSDSLTYFYKTITNNEDTVKIEKVFNGKLLNNLTKTDEYGKQIFYYDSKGNIFKKEFYEFNELEILKLVRSEIFMIEYKD